MDAGSDQDSGGQHTPSSSAITVLARPTSGWDRAALYPPGRVATAQEVAEMIAFFASEESSGLPDSANDSILRQGTRSFERTLARMVHCHTHEP